MRILSLILGLTAAAFFPVTCGAHVAAYQASANHPREVDTNAKRFEKGEYDTKTNIITSLSSPQTLLDIGLPPLPPSKSTRHSGISASLRNQEILVFSY